MIKKIGIIGFGEMGKRHSREFSEATCGYIQTQAVVEPDDRKYQEGCKWINFNPKRYISIADMLSRENLDGIIIASPNYMHLEHLQEFAGMDIPILLEKPLDTSIEKIKEILSFEENYGGPVVVDHVMRYAPIIRKAKSLIEAGVIGKFCSFNFVQTIGGKMFYNFRRTMAGGGGQLLEKATHDFDVLLYLTSALPRRVVAICKRQVYGGNAPNSKRCSSCEKRICCPDVYPPHSFPSASLKDVNQSNDLCPYAEEIDIADNESCLIELDNNIFGTYSHCYFVRSDSSREYEIIGNKGIMRISLSIKDPRGDGKIKISPRYAESDCDLMEIYFNYHGKIHYNGGSEVARHFYNVMNHNDKPFTTVKQAFWAEMISYSAMKSARTGQFSNIVDFVPGTCKKQVKTA